MTSSMMVYAFESIKVTNKTVHVYAVAIGLELQFAVLNLITILKKLFFNPPKNYI